MLGKYSIAELQPSPNSLLFIQFKDPVYGLLMPTFKVDFPSLVKAFWKSPHRHLQRLVSMVNLNLSC